MGYGFAFCQVHFYPRSPCGERHDGLIASANFCKFLSTLSLRRATRRHRGNDRRPVNFYPRSPCGERLCILTIIICTVLFLSTLSLRRATCYSLRYSAQGWYFYPRSPCGERRWLRCWQLAARDISIHALLAESDNRYGRPIDVQLVFLSTLSLRRATLNLPSSPMLRNEYFYPRSPCGERLKLFPKRFCNALFLSTLSLRRATPEFWSLDSNAGISIHALLAESDKAVLGLDNCY